jgi:Flp pilus assembly pilin Flp
MEKQGGSVFRLLMDFWRGKESRPSDQSPPVDSETPNEQPQEVDRRHERGQSVVEYAIILTWLTLAFIGVIRGVGQYTHAIWVTANSNLTQANTTGGGH